MRSRSIGSLHVHRPVRRHRTRHACRRGAQPASWRAPNLGDPCSGLVGLCRGASPEHRLDRTDPKVDSMTDSVAVSGASGYAGGEILRLIADHPEFEVRTVTAHANAGQPLVAVQPHLRTYTHLTLQETSAETLSGHDVVFLALPHGASGAIAAELAADTLVIDCGADHRLERATDWAEFYGGDFHGAWAYGVPELPRLSGTQRERLTSSRRIAAPGCNASTVALSLAPGIRAGVIEDRDLVA